jgi:hypothetical protein
MMAVSEDVKEKLRKILIQSKDKIENIKDSLAGVDDSKEADDSKAARKHLMDAEFSILAAMHEISWIGLEHEKEIQEEVLSYTGEDNPSAE